MSKPKTYVALILDQSGSMSATKAQAVQGYNEQVQQMKLNSKDQDIFCSLVTFNGEIFEHLWCEKAELLAEASIEDYKTEGSTAFRDAIGYTIEKLKKTTDDKDAAYLVVIVSDGFENSSTHYSPSRLRELKDSVDKTNKWTFTYMGCEDRHLKEVARELNIPISNMAKWSNATPELANIGMANSAKKMKDYYSNRSLGVLKALNVYNDSNELADFTNENKEVLEKVNVGPGIIAPFKNYEPVSWLNQ